MVILHIMYSLRPGGIESFLTQLTKNLPKDRVETNIICFYDGELRETLESFGAKVYLLGKIRNPFFIYKLYRLINKINPDVINNHITITAGINSIISKMLNKPFILYSHNDIHVTYRTSSFFYSFILFINLLIAKKIQTKGVGVSKLACISMWGRNYKKRCVEYISLGIDLCRYNPINTNINQNFKSYFRIPDDYSVVLNVAGYRVQKNYEFFLRVASKVLDKNPKVHFLLIGEGEERCKIERTIKDLHIENSCTLTGFSSQVPEILKSIGDVLLFPSLSEGLGLALVEAQAAGLQCVFSDVIPQEAIILTENCSSLSLNDSIDTWSSLVLKKIEEQKISPIDKNKAFVAVQNSSFNICKTVEKYIKLWESLI